MNRETPDPCEAAFSTVDCRQSEPDYAASQNQFFGGEGIISMSGAFTRLEKKFKYHETNFGVDLVLGLSSMG